MADADCQPVAAADLSDRIVRALEARCTADEVQAVLMAAEAEFRDLEERADALDVQALSPLLTLPDALARRAAAADMRFLSDRLDASVSALKARVADLRDAEAKAAKQAERDAVLAERDELAGEIAERYPVLVRELTALVQRIAACDERCKAAGISESAESIGRGIPASFYEPRRGNFLRIGAGTLPMPADPRPAWGPENDRIGAATVYPGRDA